MCWCGMCSVNELIVYSQIECIVYKMEAGCLYKYRPISFNGILDERNNPDVHLQVCRGQVKDISVSRRCEILAL